MAKRLHNYHREALGSRLFHKIVRSIDEDVFLTASHLFPLRDFPTTPQVRASDILFYAIRDYVPGLTIMPWLQAIVLIPCHI